MPNCNRSCLAVISLRVEPTQFCVYSILTSCVDALTSCRVYIYIVTFFGSNFLTFKDYIGIELLNANDSEW